MHGLTTTSSQGRSDGSIGDYIKFLGMHDLPRDSTSRESTGEEQMTWTSDAARMERRQLISVSEQLKKNMNESKGPNPVQKEMWNAVADAIIAVSKKYAQKEARE